MVEEIKVETIPQTDVTTQVDTQVTTPFLKVKYNHEEMELDEEKAKEYAQKGLNYDKVKSQLDELLSKEEKLKLQTEADEFYSGKADEVFINDPEKRLEYYTLEKSKQEQSNLDNQQKQLLAKYPSLKIDEILPELTQKFKDEGIPFVASFELKLKDEKLSKTETELSARLAELEEKLKIRNKNEENAGSSVGSAASGGGQIETDFITADEFEKNSKDQNWIIKNFDKIVKSRPKW